MKRDPSISRRDRAAGNRAVMARPRKLFPEALHNAVKWVKMGSIYSVVKIKLGFGGQGPQPIATAYILPHLLCHRSEHSRWGLSFLLM